MHRYLVLAALLCGACFTPRTPSDQPVSGTPDPIKTSSTVKGADGQELTLSKPSDQSVRRGQTREIDIRISKRNIGSVVAIAFENLPAGVTVAERDRKVQPDEHVVTYTLVVAPDAGLVQGHVARVKASTPDGTGVSETFGIDVIE